MAVERGPIAARQSMVRCDGASDRCEHYVGRERPWIAPQGWDAVRAAAWEVGRSGVRV